MPPSFMWTLGHAATAAMPLRQVASHLVVPVGVRADPHQASNMVQDNGQLRYGLAEICQLGQLREVKKNIQGQSHSCQHPRAGPEIVIGQLTFGFPVRHLWVRVPSNTMADAAKTG